jgi:membrane-associated phospholipid phosphatase
VLAKLTLSGSRFVILVPLLIIGIRGQTIPTPTPAPAAKSYSTTHKPDSNFLKDIASDQKAIWTSPFHIGHSDWTWLAPFGLITGGLIATDKRTSSWVDTGGSLPGVSTKVSWNGGIYVAAGVSAGMYTIGRWRHDDKLRETGRLAGEALADSQIVTQASKFAFGRLRPSEGDAEGRFFKGGRSFFSGHASASWSVATVIACEYDDNPYAVIGAYGLATAVSLSRYTSRKHFLSDIFVGAGVGYGIGRYVCQKRRVTHTDADDNDTLSRHWRVSPYFNAATGVKGGAFVWSF